MSPPLRTRGPMKRKDIPLLLVMGMKKTCDVCGKPAIGIQMLGCCSASVCEEHAESFMKELKPGEQKSWGTCFFYRFE